MTERMTSESVGMSKKRNDADMIDADMMQA